MGTRRPGPHPRAPSSLRGVKATRGARQGGLPPPLLGRNRREELAPTHASCAELTRGGREPPAQRGRCQAGSSGWPPGLRAGLEGADCT